MQLDEWLARLETFSPQEIDLGLERVTLLLDRLALDIPKTVIHVAGTNGKGSSVALLEALLRSTDQRVGCYTSPHLERYNERIRIDGSDVADADIVAAFEQVEAQRRGVPLTYFEFGTLAALLIFAQQQVDIAVLEIGLGGRLDAVNAVEPTASLITNVSLDHCDWLGNTVEEIAREKAGVMRSDKPVVFAAPEMPLAIADEADSRQANLIAASRDYHWSIEDETWTWRGQNHVLQGLVKPQLAGDIQIQNAAGALALLEATGFDSLLETGPVNAALGTVTVPGRAQLVADQFVLDVAHNPAAAEALAQTISVVAQDGVKVTIIGMLDDKDVAGVVRPLAALTEHWIAVTAESPRAIHAKALARQVADASAKPCETADSMRQAIARASELAKPAEHVLVTGSFYTVGAALVILAAPGHEYG
jgi:dihydrofolate synthase/folylpolyglutamate synthase